MPNERSLPLSVLAESFINEARSPRNVHGGVTRLIRHVYADSWRPHCIRSYIDYLLALCVQKRHHASTGVTPCLVFVTAFIYACDCYLLSLRRNARGLCCKIWAVCAPIGTGLRLLSTSRPTTNIRQGSTWFDKLRV